MIRSKKIPVLILFPTFGRRKGLMHTLSLILGLPKRGNVPKELCAVECSRYYLPSGQPNL